MRDARSASASRACSRMWRMVIETDMHAFWRHLRRHGPRESGIRPVGGTALLSTVAVLPVGRCLVGRCRCAVDSVR